MVKEATRKRELAIQDKTKHTGSISSAGNGQFVDVILISCSKTKTDAKGRNHPMTGGISDQVADARIARLALDLRSKVLRLIQEGKIEGIEFSEGNRAAMPDNQKLQFGPDFGGVINEQRYLPACARYKGRCFQANESEWEAMYDKANHPRFLIMSGLYGLIPAGEYIQNYDVHLTDGDLSTGISLQTYWRDRELMTRS